MVLIREEEPLDDGKILHIIDASERYSRCTQCFSTEQGARLPKNKFWNHQIVRGKPAIGSISWVGPNWVHIWV